MEKRSDISRDSFRPEQGYTSVRLQQGRPQLDADWNEQIDIQLVRERTALMDILGPAAAVPQDPNAPLTSAAGLRVRVQTTGNTITGIQIDGGRVYLDGRLVDVQGSFDFVNQPFCPNLKLPTLELPTDDTTASLWIVYLEVFERDVSTLDDPVLQEKALGGPDTATRTQLVWQVRLLEINPSHPAYGSLQARLTQGFPATFPPSPPGLALTIPELAPLAPGRFSPESLSATSTFSVPGLLRARFADQGATLENRLYRVEITDAAAGRVRLRWSRDNGAVVARIQGIEARPDGGQILVLSRPLVGDASVFAPGQWLEISTSGSQLRGDAPLYRRIQSQGQQEAGSVRVPIEGTIDLRSFASNDGVLTARLWNSNANDATYPLEVPLRGPAGSKQISEFFRLEDGLEVQLELPDEPQISFRFARGQYWQIPMRASIGGIDWPQDLAREPQLARHSYLALGVLLADRFLPRSLFLPGTDPPVLQHPLNRTERESAPLVWTFVGLAPALSPTGTTARLESRIAELRQALIDATPRSGDIDHVFTPSNRRPDIEERFQIRIALNFRRLASISYFVQLLGLNVAIATVQTGASAVRLLIDTPVRSFINGVTIDVTLPPGFVSIRLRATLLAIPCQNNLTSADFQFSEPRIV